MNDQGLEKRRDKRSEISLDVTLEKESKLQRFVSKNISKGGIFVEVDQEIPLGQQIKISISLPGQKKPLCLTAEVAHHHIYQELDDNFNEQQKVGLGLKFINLGKKEKKLLEECLAATN